jgi:hypothetical protein
MRWDFGLRYAALWTTALAAGAFLSAGQPASAQFIAVSPSTISGKTILLDEGSSLQYRRDGTYVYTLGGRVSQGKWRIGPNGAVCIDFSNGGGRCDFYLEQNGSLYLKNSSGRLFKVRFAG